MITQLYWPLLTHSYQDNELCYALLVQNSSGYAVLTVPGSARFDLQGLPSSDALRPQLWRAKPSRSHDVHVLDLG